MPIRDPFPASVLRRAALFERASARRAHLHRSNCLIPGSGDWGWVLRLGIETHDRPSCRAPFLRPLPQHPSQPALKLERLSGGGEKSSVHEIEKKVSAATVVCS